MKSTILIISLLLNFNCNFAQVKKLEVNELTSPSNSINQTFKVPPGYKEKSDGVYVYGSWFITRRWYSRSFYSECEVESYGLDNYYREKFYDFNITLANQKINFNLYRTNDNKGYFATTLFDNYCITIGVYKSGRFALSSEFDYKKHITNIYEYLFLNN